MLKKFIPTRTTSICVLRSLGICEQQREGHCLELQCATPKKNTKQSASFLHFLSDFSESLSSSIGVRAWNGTRKQGAAFAVDLMNCQFPNTNFDVDFHVRCNAVLLFRFGLTLQPKFGFIHANRTQRRSFLEAFEQERQGASLNPAADVRETSEALERCLNLCALHIYMAKKNMIDFFAWLD